MAQLIMSHSMAQLMIMLYDIAQLMIMLHSMARLMIMLYSMAQLMIMLHGISQLINKAYFDQVLSHCYITKPSVLSSHTTGPCPTWSQFKWQANYFLKINFNVTYFH